MTSPIKALIALPAFLFGNAARLCLLVGLLVVPVSLVQGENGLVFKSGAAYASDNGNMNDGSDNSASDGAGPGSGPGSGFGLNGGTDSNADSGAGVVMNLDTGAGSEDSPDSNQGEVSNGAADNGHPASSDDDKAANSSFGGANGEDSETDESHRGVTRPANLTEFLSSLRNGSRIVNAQREGNNIEIEYSDGWQEQIEDGIYKLSGPNDNVVIKRPATKRDYMRLNSAF